MFDGESFGAEIVAHVRSHVSNSVAPLLSEISILKARIADLESREPLRGEKGDPGERGQPGESVMGPPGNDGVGIASSFIDREGNLVLTFTDGTVGSVGRVVGGQGDPGKDGKDGENGRDGFGFDDMSVTMLEDGHTMLLKFTRGDAVKVFPIILPNTKYCGIFIEGQEYKIGDLVTWAGSLWHANNVTKDKPGTGSPHWTLATKRGRDGKDGQSIQGPPGPQGRPGRDLTQMGPDGVKF